MSIVDMGTNYMTLSSARSKSSWLPFVPCLPSLRVSNYRKTVIFGISGLAVLLLVTQNYSARDIEGCTSGQLHAGCMNDDDVFLLSPPSKDVRIFSVISASTPSNGDYNYVFYLPLTVRAWRRLGFGTMVILIGTLSEWTASPPLFYALTEVVRLKAAVVFVKGPQDHVIMLSQTCRLFAHNIFNTLGDDVNLITSDVDWWPLRKDKYVPPKVNVIRSTDFWNHFQYKNMTVRMLRMSTITMTVKVWKEVMNVYDSTPRTGQQILDYFVRAFGDEALGRAARGNSVWYLDQRIISVRIKMWATRNGEEKVDYIRRKMRARINRRRWVVPQSIKGYNDAHLIPDGFRLENWRKIRPLLKMMYTESEMWQCDEYFQIFSRIVRQA